MCAACLLVTLAFIRVAPTPDRAVSSISAQDMGKELGDRETHVAGLILAIDGWLSAPTHLLWSCRCVGRGAEVCVCVTPAGAKTQSTIYRT